MNDALDPEPMGLQQMQPIFEAVSRKYRIPVHSIVGPGKNPLAAEARQVSCWLGSKLTRLTPKEIGRTIGRGRSAVGQALARIERLRSDDDQKILIELTDALLAQLQQESRT